MANLSYAFSVIRDNEDWAKEQIAEYGLELVRKVRHDAIPLAILGGAPYPITVFVVTGDQDKLQELHLDLAMMF